MAREMMYREQGREVHTLGDCEICGDEIGPTRAHILCDGDPDHEDTFCNKVYHIKCLNGTEQPKNYKVKGYLGPCCRPIIRPFAHTPEHAARPEWALRHHLVPGIIEIPEHRPTQRKAQPRKPSCGPTQGNLGTETQHPRDTR